MIALAVLLALSGVGAPASSPHTLGHKHAIPPSAAQPTDSGAAFLAANKAHDRQVLETPSGLQYKVFAAGAGTSPTDDDVALINYEGRLADGTVFDKSAHPAPLSVNGVVPGFSEALKLMRKGAKYRVWIKPSLGYGDAATGPIPAHAVLVFDIQLLAFLPAGEYERMQAQAMDRQQDATPATAPIP